MSIRFEAELDTEKFQKGMQGAQATGKKAIASMVTGMRRTAQLGISLSQAFGGAMSQTAQLGIESAMITLELVTSTTVASLATPAGLLLAGARLGAIISMLTVIHQLKRHEMDSAQRTQGLVSAFRLLSF